MTLSEDIIMAQQGAALQSYNNELVKSIEELLQRRAALNKQIEAESNEKTKLEQQKPLTLLQEIQHHQLS